MKKEIFKPIEFCEHTIAFKRFIEVQWLELAGQLKEIRDQALYRGRWESFEDFLNDPEMAMDKSTASKMITIHERFILEYKIQPQKIANVGGWSKVAELLPVVKNKESAEEWLDKATVLSQADLRKEVKGENRGDGIDCKHKNNYQITLSVCRDCGYKETIKTNE